MTLPNLPVMPEFSSLVELLRYRAQTQPNQLAFAFLADGECESDRLTYQALDRRACAIAAELQERKLAGERALLLYPPGLEFLCGFFGCLYAGVVAVPAYPPRNQRNTPRIQAIAQDAQAAIALTTEGMLAKTQSLMSEKTHLNHWQWLASDRIDSQGIKWEPSEVNCDHLAFLQYTSGSTGIPKGVMLTHGNLLHNAITTRSYMEHSPASKFVTWLPMYHDMGLIGGILQPLYGGFPCFMMPPTAFLQSPYRWLKAISDHQGTTSGGPNFAYELCVQKITPAQRQTLDLSSWQVAFNGAEPVRAETLERFAEVFAECGFQPQAFYPCYGMAEATLMVAGVEKSALPRVQSVCASALEKHQILMAEKPENRQQFVGCGRSIPDQKIVIVDPATCKQCSADQVGEIWVSGPSIGQGYWQRVAETQETFQAYISDTGEGPFLRTGDLGFLQNNELFITGRLKDLIIIRGRNLYPQDIEKTAENTHPVLRAGSNAAFAVEVNGEERLVIVQEVEFRQKPNTAEVTDLIRQAIAQEYEVQPYAVVLIQGGTIPKTSSGKIQRRACKQLFLENQLSVIGSSLLEPQETTLKPFNFDREKFDQSEPEQQQLMVEKYLYHLLGYSGENHQNFAEVSLSGLGFDSLKVFELKNKLEANLGCSLPIGDFFTDDALSLLAGKLCAGIRNKSSVSVPVISDWVKSEKKDTKQDFYPLSFSQQGLWLIEQLAPNTATYNIAITIEFTGKLQAEILAKALEEIVRRHDSLRTHFQIIDNQPVQVIDPLMMLPFSAVDLRSLSVSDRSAKIQDFITTETQQPFDLSQSPLLRVKLLHLTDIQHTLLVTLHHAIADGWSISIFVRELAEIYAALVKNQGIHFADLSLQYHDFATWQQQDSSINLDFLLNYWQQQLAGNLPILDLPTDRPRSRVQTFKGAQRSRVLSSSLTTAIKRLCQQEGTTLFMTLLAAFKALLYRYSGQTDILIGSPIANRNDTAIENLIGCFVNVLVLRTKVAETLTFKELLQQVRQVALEAYTHQDLPFKTLVEALQPERDLSYNPLFQVMFALQNIPVPAQQLSEISLVCQTIETGTAKFDLTLFIEEKGAELVAKLEYKTDLFDTATIERMLGHYETLLQAIVTHIHLPISQLPLLPDSERHQLLVEFNQTPLQRLTKDVNIETCFHQLFEEQVAKTPDAIAVIFQDQALTYQQLNQRANQLANYLQKLGVQPEVLVGIALTRSPLMLIALLGILKAGGAYIPLDPAYPAERLAFMLADTQVSLLLTQADLTEKFTDLRSEEMTSDFAMICLDTDWEKIARESEENPRVAVKANHLAYVIYTSGSTGKPKGTLIEHRGLTNYLTWAAEAYHVAEGRGATVHSSISFDMTITGLFSPLIVGRSVELLPEEEGLEALANALKNRQNYSLVKITPAQLELLSHQLRPEEAAGKTKAFIIGGENLVAETLSFWQKNAPDTLLVNEYGPTETVVGCCVYVVPNHQQESGSVLIGRAIANTQLYILDAHLQPVPIGIVGELYIGGAGVARGYLNRPELTAQKFIPNPFSDRANARLYKTGDLARYLPDGNIEFLGRIDHQVKIRGYRIELGEIEAILNQHPAVRECVVIDREMNRDRRLVAYVVPQQNFLNTAVLREFLKEKLPEYMVPSAFVKLNHLPLTINGKVDRNALPEPDSIRPELSNVYVAPQTEIEQQIAKIWQAVLELETVGIHDNFFDLGGHSLRMVQVHEQLKKTLQKEISLVDLFEYSTIYSCAKYLGKLPEKELNLQVIGSRADKQRNAIARKRLTAKKGMSHE